MDLKEFNSPLPKPWLNINANSVHVGPGGGGVSAVQYSQLSTVTVTNTVGPSSLSAGSTAIGSLTLPPLPIGSIVKLTAIGFSSLSAGNSENFALYVNGVNVTGTTGMSSFTGSNIGTEIQAYLAVRPSGMAVPSLFVQAGASSGFTGVSAQGGQLGVPFAYSNALATNTIDLQVNFNVAAVTNSFICLSFFAELVGAN